MFVLIGVRDTVPVKPEAFEIPAAITIQDAINKKYANKLIPQKGLGLSCFDILTAEDGRVTWGNGLMYYKVSFRLLLFAPFIGEVLVGQVLSTTKSYIRVSMGFFNDIYITPNLLPPNSAYDPNEERFFWLSDPEPEDRVYTQHELLNTVVTSRLFIDPGEPIRFRVSDIEWQDVRPQPKARHDIANGHEEESEEDPFHKAGYKIFATIADVGLGVVSWWADAEEVGEEAMDES
ncbi:RNA polymerase III subunit Rpc25-domain-containing protein [Kockovaella imperatae]|uniref:RNA polymerase III subunit Rpc25-domain-containing protein n=1 Tax=Kockovaella imperatae TaxID=4999 RepID=A0A1Y1U8Z1_9TREE|nr:RNA polymerase III subunit Rpc25-domain-containing protein [Kockovaella imperatae]ORX33967.1 RNA polymerase III subunit Rpc25-domain-containing protein [Kockovaella imperatae]